MNLVKKLVALALATALVMTGFVGCARKAEIPNNDEVVMVINKEEVKMGITNFYVRYQQSLMESLYQSYMGPNVWKQEMEQGVTYEDNMKETLLKEFQKILIIVQHAEEYKVSLTDKELEAIDKAADSFDKENKKDVKELISGTKEIVTAYFKLVTLNDKMEDAIKAKADSEISDDEAAQKKMRYVTFTKKADAEEFLKAAKANGSLETYAKEKAKETKTQTFDKDSAILDKAVIKAADSLELNGFADVVTVKDKDDKKEYYVLQLESLMDATATAEAKKTMLEERQKELYDETVEKWVKDAKIDLKEKVWAKISLDGLSVLTVTEEAKTDDKTKDDTTEDTSKDATK